MLTFVLHLDLIKLVYFNGERDTAHIQVFVFVGNVVCNELGVIIAGDLVEGTANRPDETFVVVFVLNIDARLGCFDGFRKFDPGGGLKGSVSYNTDIERDEVEEGPIRTVVRVLVNLKIK